MRAPYYGILLRFTAIMLLSAVIIGIGAAPRRLQAADSVRVTTSFEVKHTGAVLKQVAKLFPSGFGRTAAERLAREIDALKANQPRVWDFSVVYRGAAHPLQVRAQIDDLGMIDLDFATSAELAPLVRRAVDNYLNSQGL
jgi:hypothetical protein